ncbi:MAG: T9SS type A sorting domain-containing protein [bacterium]
MKKYYNSLPFIVSFILTLLIIPRYTFSQPVTETLNISGNITTDSIPVQNALITFIDETNPAITFSVLTDTAGNYNISVITFVEDTEPIIPRKIELAQNYPNPFSNSTTITYKTNEPEVVTIKIYDILGREIKTLIADELSIGTKGIVWDGRNNSGVMVSPGIYFYMLNTGKEFVVKKMLLEPTVPGIINTIHNQSVTLPITKKPIKKTNAGNLYTIEVTNTDCIDPGIIEESFKNMSIQSDTTLNLELEPADEILYIEYTTDDPVNGILHICDIEGTYHKKVTDSVYIYSGARWSPDGEWIAYPGAYHGYENYQIYIVKADGSQKRIVTLMDDNGIIVPNYSGGSGPAWSPDSKRIAFTRSLLQGLTCEIFIVDIDTSNGIKEERVTFNLFIDGVFDWSPDGSKILFESELTSEGEDDLFYDLYTMNVDGSGKERIFINENGTGQFSFRYSPDGSKIACSYRYDNSSENKLYIMNSDGSNIKKIRNKTAHHISWSPDGNCLAFMADYIYWGGEIYIINVNGTGTKKINTGNAVVTSPDWRPKRNRDFIRNKMIE